MSRDCGAVRRSLLGSCEILTLAQLTRLELVGENLRQATVRELSPTDCDLSALRDSEEQLESIFNNSTNGLALTESASGKILKVNDTWVRDTGISRSDAIGKTPSDLNMWAHQHEREACLAALGRDGRLRDFEATLAFRGVERYLVLNANYLDLRRGRYLLWELRDITERKRAEAILRRYELLAMHSRDIVLFVRRDDGRILDANAAALAAYGYSRDELLSLSIRDLRASDARTLTEEQMTVADSSGIRFETVHRSKDGCDFPVEVSSAGATIGDVRTLMSVVRDISERRRAEAETAKLTDQLHQAQKMESVGRLAGGVAHDFNNMLGVILGHAELAMEKVNPAGTLHKDLASIRAAAQRSADLTRQLLAFARKQTITPKVLNLNDTVAGMLKMLKRLIGEDIELGWRPGENLWPVNIDPAQIDQILANLCVNARDAIANVGKIAIETGTKVVDADVAATRVGVLPGDYVWISVIDDGCGMDPSTRSKIFEPFFTTKDLGKGTGLGLATVYGIVKQNNGFIDVRSDLGQGSAFTVGFPRYTGKAVPARVDGAAGTLEVGQGTILLVEDEASLLGITQRMLEKRGYKVLPAATPGQAIQLAREHTGRIDLLITDVIMPEMNGRDLARNFLSLYPQAKRLFMSGYTADVIAHQGVLDPGVFFIQKPFSAKDLAAMVRKVLDG